MNLKKRLGLKIDINSNIAKLNQHLRFIIIDPAAVYVNQDQEICLIPAIDAPITIKKVVVTCELAPASELDWNLKYCDAFIGQANPVLICALNTVAGVAVVTSFINAVVPAGKCIYVPFDMQPAALPNQICTDIFYKYN